MYEAAKTSLMDVTSGGVECVRSYPGGEAIPCQIRAVELSWHAEFKLSDHAELTDGERCRVKPGEVILLSARKVARSTFWDSV